MIIHRGNSGVPGVQKQLEAVSCRCSCRSRCARRAEPQEQQLSLVAGNQRWSSQSNSPLLQLLCNFFPSPRLGRFVSVLNQGCQVLLSKMCFPEETMGALLTTLNNIRSKFEYLLQKPPLPWSDLPCPSKTAVGRCP